MGARLQILFLEMKGFVELLFGLFLFTVWGSVILNILLMKDMHVVSFRRIQSLRLEVIDRIRCLEYVVMAESQQERYSWFVEIWSRSI